MGSCKYLIRSYRLDEITKFHNISSNHGLIQPKRVALWSMSDDLDSKSERSIRQQALFSYLFLHGLGCKPPQLVVDKKSKIAHIMLLNLYSKGIYGFFDKLFMVYNCKIRKKLFLSMFFYSNYSRTRIEDFNLFADLSHAISIFQLYLNHLFIDIHVSFFRRYQFVYFLDLLNRSSY